MKSHTLLLADDSVTIHRLVELTFAEHDLRVVSVSDGQQALERLATEPPDIVLAAINMPRVDGYQVADYIRSQPKLSAVPVLLLAGAFDVIDEQRVQQVGAQGVLVKPFEHGAVINRIKELLGLRAKEERPATTPSPTGRLITSPTTPLRSAPASVQPETPASSGVAPPPQSAAPPLYHHEAPTAWDQIHEATGLAPDTRLVDDPADTGTDDYFERLDEAFDSLDAQLSRQQGPPERTNPRPPAPRLPASIDPAMRRGAPIVDSDLQSELATHAQAAQPPVYEVDSGWFEPDQGNTESVPEELAAESVALPPRFATPAPAAPDAPAPVAQPAPAYRTEPASSREPIAPAASVRVADAFENLLAAEQGEVPVHHYPVEISDDVIDRIAAGVAERLSRGTLMETVTRVVTEVSERLVREEIARIRGAAQRKDT